MGIFDKLKGNKKESTTTIETPPCVHAVLLPRWDSVQDMGIEEKATGYVCESCQQEFTPDEVRVIRAGSLSDKLVGVGMDTPE